MAIHAVLFDVDGTLYRQPLLRALMAAELGCSPIARWPAAPPRRLWRMLRTFRLVREELRHANGPRGPLERLQYAAAAERAGVPLEAMEAAVREWILERPLRHMPRTARPEAASALQALKDAGLTLGVFSDYPTRAKIAALGLEPFISLHLCATDTEIDAFKPHPRGFLAACEQWGLPPAEVLYVGDRAETDLAGATAAGLPCALIGRRPVPGARPVRSLREICPLVGAGPSGLRI